VNGKNTKNTIEEEIQQIMDTEGEYRQ